MTLAGVLLVWMGLWRYSVTRSQAVNPAEPDLAHPHNLGKDVLWHLRKQGSNLHRPHRMDFYFYFRTQAAAEQTAGALQARGFTTRVDRAALGDKWLCLATRRLFPDQLVLDRWGQWFERLAASAGGEYDGWESSIEPE
jgi:Regulator of ribonuclease activity B